MSTLLLSYIVPVKSKVEIWQNFVALSEYMNFKTFWKVEKASVFSNLGYPVLSDGLWSFKFIFIETFRYLNNFFANSEIESTLIPHIVSEETILFLKMEIVENSNSCCMFQFFT